MEFVIAHFNHTLFFIWNMNNLFPVFVKWMCFAIWRKPWKCKCPHKYLISIVKFHLLLQISFRRDTWNPTPNHIFWHFYVSEKITVLWVIKFSSANTITILLTLIICQWRFRSKITRVAPLWLYIYQ